MCRLCHSIKKTKGHKSRATATDQTDSFQSVSFLLYSQTSRSGCAFSSFCSLDTHMESFLAFCALRCKGYWILLGNVWLAEELSEVLCMDTTTFSFQLFFLAWMFFVNRKQWPLFLCFINWETCWLICISLVWVSFFWRKYVFIINYVLRKLCTCIFMQILQWMKKVPVQFY